MQIKHPRYFGQLLLSKGFRVWFKYMFFVIEETKFIEEPIHEDVFVLFDDLHELKKKRENLNIPPRSAKTTLAKYFLAYCWAKNSKSNFIYTSFSQSLLSDIARSLIDILEHPVYKAMYDLSVSQEIEEVNPVNDFWREYLENDEGKKEAKYSTRKLVSPTGGVILFSSIGASITGFGAGIRSAKEFSGALIIDDGNKPSDIHSQLMREKCLIYFEETLLSRLNNPHVPILNIQQRLHVDDLTGKLSEKYNFNSLSKPLMVDGVCQLPSQYTPERIKEIMVNDYMFQAQYQQKPYIKGGNIFKSKYWKYYNVAPVMQWRGIYGDTAQKTQEHNDYSVFQCWGVSLTGQAHLIDQIRGKWESPELLVEARAFWNKHKADRASPLRFMKIEDKSSGSGLIQTISREGVPVIPVQRNTDKVMRANDVVPLIESGNVYLPENAPWLSEYLAEFTAFSPLKTHKHDDQIDPTMDALTDILQGHNINYKDII